MFISRHKFRSDTNVLSQHPLPLKSMFSYHEGGVLRRSAVKLLFCNNDNNLQTPRALASETMRDVQVQVKVPLISKMAGKDVIKRKSARSLQIWLDYPVLQRLQVGRRLQPRHIPGSFWP